MITGTLIVLIVLAAGLFLGRRSRERGLPAAQTSISDANAGQNIVAVTNSPGAQVLTQSGSGWIRVAFDAQEDLRAALSGDALGPRQVIACPPVPEVEEIVERLRRTGVAAVVGESGSGKSMAAWHAAYRLHQDGWSVYFLSNPNAPASPPQTDARALYLVDDAQAIPLLPVQAALAHPRRAVLVIASTEVPGFRNSIRIAPKRAVDAIAAAFAVRADELLPVLQSLDSRIGERFLDTTVERQIEFARRSSETPWQFMFNLSSGELRLKHKLDAVTGSPPLDLVLFCVAVGQLASGGRPCPLPWLNATLRSQSDGRIDTAAPLLDSLHSHIALLRNAEGVATPHARVAGMVLRAMYSGDKAPDKKRRELLWDVLREESFPVGGALWLIDELPEPYRWGLPPEVAEALLQRCLHASDGERGAAGHVLARIIGSRGDDSRIEEVVQTLVEWLRACTAENASGVASALNSVINFDIHEDNERRRAAGAQAPEGFASARHGYSKAIVEAAGAAVVAAKISQATLETAYIWANLLGRIACAADEAWSKAFVAEVDESRLMGLCASCPAASVDSLAALIHELEYFAEGLALRMAEAIVPTLAEALRKDLLGVFNEVRDLIWWTLRLGPRYFVQKRPDDRRRRIATELFSAVGGAPFAASIATAKPRHWHVLAQVVPLLRELVPDVAEYVATGLDEASLVRRAAELAAESRGNLDEVLLTLYLTKDLQPASRVAEQVCVPLNRMTVRAACLAPKAAAKIVRSNGTVDLELKGGLPNWELAFIAVAAMYQADAPAAPILLRTNLAQLADAFVYQHAKGGEGARRFIDAVRELDASVLTEAMQLVDIDQARKCWPDRARGTAEERTVLSRLLAIATSAGGRPAELASAITCETPPEPDDEESDDDVP